MDEDDVEGSERSAQHAREKKVNSDRRQEKKEKEYEAKMEAKAKREAQSGNRPNVLKRQNQAASEAETEMEDMVKESLRKKRGTPQSSPRRKDPKHIQNELLEMEKMVVAQNAEKQARLARSDKERGPLG